MVKDIYFLFALVEELDTCERSVIFDMLCHSNGFFSHLPSKLWQKMVWMD